MLSPYHYSKQITLNETRDKLRETYKKVRKIIILIIKHLMSVFYILVAH